MLSYGSVEGGSPRKLLGEVLEISLENRNDFKHLKVQGKIQLGCCTWGLQGLQQGGDKSLESSMRVGKCGKMPSLLPSESGVSCGEVEDSQRSLGLSSS